MACLQAIGAATAMAGPAAHGKGVKLMSTKEEASPLPLLSLSCNCVSAYLQRRALTGGQGIG